MLFDTISLELFSHTDSWKENGDVLLHDRFFMLRDFNFARKDFLESSQPYRLQEGRIVIVKRGSARYSFNLEEFQFEAGDVVVFMADTLIEKQGHSEDFEVDAISFDFKSSSLPNLGEGLFSLHLNEHSRLVVSRYIDLMWDMAHEQPFPEDNLHLLLNSLLLYINSQPGHISSVRPVGHRDDMLKRFITLVSQHATHARNIPFYADKLCLAPHYLSALVKEISGKTVMQWINQVAVKEIKVWLAYSDETAAQIAYRLNFPSPSSLTKFFKREMGMTPSEYRSARKQIHHTTSTTSPS